MKIETLAVHAGHETDPGTGAVTHDISVHHLRAGGGRQRQGYFYSRLGNRTGGAGSLLAALEGGAVAAAFASGAAATMSVLQCLAPAIT